MQYKYLIIFTISFVTFSSCIYAQEKDSPVIIPLQKNVAVTINGIIEEDEWTECLKITKFLSPWLECEIPETTFYVCSDKTDLYFAFKVADENIILVPGKEEENVALGDRVEIFLTGDKELNEYYCFEIGPFGNVLDYKASYYRSFDNKWNASGLLVRTSVSESGYEVEGRIPLSSVNIKEDCFYMGVYRADFNSHGQDETSALWLTWIDPLQERPDFHIFSSFQKICFK